MKSLSLLLVLAVAVPAFAVTYVVPADRFEIERASAIVTGRVLSSHAEESRYGIETITSVAVDEVIKGTAGSVVRIHEPGGSLGDEMRIVPGAPRFSDGDRLLLFLCQRDDGEYSVLDLQLGFFRFEKDVAGRQLVVRNESEIEGWDPGGGTHREERRSAELFLDYVRAVVHGETVTANYVVANVSLKPMTQAVASANPAFTATSYMLFYTGAVGTRWNVFPAAVQWNQGNSETGALGSGAAEISNAFSIWNAGGTHYVLSGAQPNSKGFLDAFDGVNNFVFEKNLTSAGVPAFNCVSGGTLGMGGMTHAIFGAGEHVFHGETFATTVEADVSMNQGLGGCTKAQVTADEFQTVIVHELGHTLGFRHSDQNRQLNAACSTDPTLDCSSAAVMNHILVFGINGQLQTWDKAALDAVYGSGPACVPPSLATQPAGSTIVSGSSAQLSIAANGTAPLTYQWFFGSTGDTSTAVGGGTNATIVVSPAVTTSYWVRVTGVCAPFASSAAAVVTVTQPICPPVVAAAPQAIQVSDGFQLVVNASGGSPITYLWYEGAVSGSGLVIGSGNALHVNPAITTSYWCRIANSCGNSADSSVVSVTVAPKSTRQRAVRH
jgi:hypothetical protein